MCTDEETPRVDLADLTDRIRACEDRLDGAARTGDAGAVIQHAYAELRQLRREQAALEQSRQRPR